MSRHWGYGGTGYNPRGCRTVAIRAFGATHRVAVAAPERAFRAPRRAVCRLGGTATDPSFARRDAAEPCVGGVLAIASMARGTHGTSRIPRGSVRSVLEDAAVQHVTRRDGRVGQDRHLPDVVESVRVARCSARVVSDAAFDRCGGLERPFGSWWMPSWCAGGASREPAVSGGGLWLSLSRHRAGRAGARNPDSLQSSKSLAATSSVARYMTSSTDRMMTSRAASRETIVRLCVLLVVLQAIFLGLLVLAQAVPDDPIVAHLLEAVEDGTYASNSEPDNMGGTSSSFTECVPSAQGWVGQSWARGSGRYECLASATARKGPRTCAGWRWRIDRRRRGVLSLLGGLDSDNAASARAVGARGTAPDLGCDAGVHRRWSGRAGRPTDDAGVRRRIDHPVPLGVECHGDADLVGRSGAQLHRRVLGGRRDGVGRHPRPPGRRTGRGRRRGRVQLHRIPHRAGDSVDAFGVSGGRSDVLRGPLDSIEPLAPLRHEPRLALRLPLHVGDALGARGPVPRMGSRRWTSCARRSPSVSAARRVPCGDDVRRVDEREPPILARQHLDGVGRGVRGDSRRGCDADRRIPTPRAVGFVLFGMLAVPALFAPLFYELLRNFSQIHVTKAYPNVPVAVGVVLAAALFTGTVTRRSRAGRDRRDGRSAPTSSDAPSSSITSSA